MFNLKQPFATAILDKFLGLYTEAPPTSLPEGASPLSLNCDYEIADVHQRPGKESAYYFEDLFVERICGFAQSVADGPNELPWSNPINATKGITGTYASVALNTSIPAVDGLGEFAGFSRGTDVITDVSTFDVLPDEPDQTFALFTLAFPTSGGGFTPKSDWNNYSGLPTYFKEITGPDAGGGELINPVGWAAITALFAQIGNSAPTLGATAGFGGAWSTTQTLTLGPTAVQSGNTVAAFVSLGNGANTGITVSDPDNPANVFELAAVSIGNGAEIDMWLCQNVIGRANFRVFFSAPSHLVTSSSIQAIEIVAGQPGVPSLSLSEQLQALNFNFNIPSTQDVLGFELEVTGKQTNLDPSCVLVAKLLNPAVGSPTFTFQLPSVEGQVVIATPTTNWGLELTAALLNNPNFGVEIQAFSPTQACTFDISAVKIKAFLTPNPAPSMNYIKTFEEEEVFTYTLVLDSAGTLWQEDVINNPNALAAITTQILPGSFAQSTTIDEREFIAISNLTNGTDIPYTYDGTNLTRCSQVGPGAAPNVRPGAAGSSITSITQVAKHILPTSANDWLLVSDNPSDIGSFGRPNTPGNVLTIVTDSSYVVPADITPGANVVLSGFPTANGFVINNDPTGATAPPFYTIISVGQKITGQASYDAFSVTVNFTTFFNEMTPSGCGVQGTAATLTANAQVPNLEVGGQLSISGTGGGPPAGYDGTWTVLTTPNASQFTVTATKLQNNLATYSYTLISGTAPVAGQAVNVFQTLNGNGVFNVANAIITSAAPGTFSIKITGANIPSAGENGSGIVFGTIFTFDPETIVGNKSSGTIATTGIFASGTRQVCYSYLTEEDFMTAPSPILTVTIPEGATSITVSGLLPGPSNVIARVIHLTPANGGQFYNIPQPVAVTTISGTQVNTSTWVNDNTTTSVVLSFADEVLTGAIEIDVEGNNLFENIELGSPTGFASYSQRVFAIGEQNKVPNFLNWSFDGGIVVTQSTQGTGNALGGTTRTTPAGWQVDPINGNGGQVITSPKFGFSYQIVNPTGSTQAAWGMITQPAFEDEFQVPIIQASTPYSARITCSVPTGDATGGFLVADLFNPATGRVLGDFNIDLTQVGTTLVIFTGEILNQVLAPVPNGLLLRLWAREIPNNVAVTCDRIEVFPTQNPVLSTQIKGSYQENFEAFDAVTGIIKATVQNQQPVQTCFVMRDNLYLVKTKSLLSTFDNGTGEPNTWSTKQESNKCGTTSIYGVDSGEDWAVIAGQPGAFIFTGGQPTKFSSEIQKLWNWIYWDSGQTLWVVNDVTNQRILMGVPMRTVMSVNGQMTQNPWIPSDAIPAAPFPTTPNIVLAMNYSQINTGDSVAERAAVHSSSFTGKMLATDFTRKWSVWSIAAPAAAYCARSDGSDQLLIGNNAFTGKVYQLVENLMEDDGEAIDQRYLTYPFPSGDQSQQLQMAGVQKQYMFMRINTTFVGPLRIVTHPNQFPSAYMQALLPDLAAPPPGGGNLEIPLHETGERLFLEFRSKSVGSGFALQEVDLALKAHAIMPSRGRN
jgi:hypothetical protein